jgi:hypothetical protein
LAAVSACRRGDDGAPVQPPVRQLARGDHVVVEATAAEFFEARVSEVVGQQLRVQSIIGKQSELVASADVYRLPPQGATPAPGYAICRVASARWVGCRVASATTESVRATDYSGATRELGADSVLSPTALTVLNLRRAFEQNARRIEFESAVKRAGRPRAPAGWHALPRQRVLAYDGKAWYAAKVHEIEDERLHVVWQADRRMTELAKGDVVPEPPYARALGRDAIVLVRPATETAAWLPMRARTTSNEIVVENAEGERRTVRPSDVVPLSP